MLLNMGKDGGKSLKRTKDNSGKWMNYPPFNNRYKIKLTASSD